MKSAVLLFSCLFWAITSLSQEVPYKQLSPNAQISLVTCGPGQEALHAAFGHSAIRVYDPLLGIDVVYNYGIFDFDQPYFYLNFARGFLWYKLGVWDYKKFIRYYRYYNRSIEVQVLALTEGQKQAVFEFLENNRKPENRNYLYDYFYENCATKIRDVFTVVLGDTLIWDDSYVAELASFRQLIDQNTTYQAWGDYGIDMCLGMPIDKTATAYEHMYLPDYMRDAFAAATVITAQGSSEPFVKKYTFLYKPKPQVHSNGLLTPTFAFWGLFTLVALFTIYQLLKNKGNKALDFTFFFVFGLVGLFLFLLWVATDHEAAANNYNIIWLFPAHLVTSFYLIRKTVKAWLQYYLVFTILLNFCLLLFWQVLPQELHLASIPLMLIILIRSMFLIYRIRTSPTA